MDKHQLFVRHEFFGSIIFNTFDEEYYFFDHETTQAYIEVLNGKITGELEEFKEELESNHLISPNVTFLHNEKKNRLSAPLKVFLDITYRCNLFCPHCFTNSKNAHPDELTTQEVYSLLDQMKAAGSLIIAIAGGEPLLRPDIFEVITYARNLNIAVGITTNGLFINEEVATRLNDLKLQMITISIDGMEKSHDALRGKGMWKKAIENIKILRRLCPKTKIGLRNTVNSLNINEYEPLIQLADELKLDTVKFNPIRFFGRAQLHKKLLITQEQYVSFLKGVQQVKATLSVSLPKTPLDCCEYDFIDLGFGCTGGKETCNITPTGEFSGCAFLGDTYVTGNIKKSPFIELWNSTRETVQYKGNSTCHQCPQYRSCRAGCRSRAMFEYHNIDAIDPHCTMGKAITNEKLTLRNEDNVFIVYEHHNEKYSKYESFQKIETAFPQLIQNQQYRLVENDCSAPLKVFFDITQQCNSNCIHCYNNSGKALENELSTEEITRIAKELYELGICQVSIAGGEPFLRKDILAILHAFEMYNIDVWITTNGLLLTKSMVQKLTSQRIKGITISVDGLSKEKYLEIRGIDGFDLLNTNIAYLKDNFAGDLSMRLSVMKGNTSPHHVIEYAVSKGFSCLKINKTHPLGRFTHCSPYFISDNEYNEIVAEFRKLGSNYPINLELPREKYLNDSSFLPCSAGKKTISISPTGEVYPCSFSPTQFGFGSLRTMSLHAILQKNVSFSVDNPHCHACPAMKPSHHITKKVLI